MCGCAPTLAALVLIGIAPRANRAADDPPTGKAEKLVLFDGKTLDGWKNTDFSHAGDARVEDGAIVLEKGRAMSGITATRRDMPTVDYELTYEARRLAGSDFFAAATFPVGKSYITLVNGGWGGSVTGLSSLNGADASENETGTYFKYENKKWYKFRVRVTAKTIRASVDNKEVVSVDYRDRQVGTRIETRANQPLGFATWESSGALRSIEMRRLTPEEIAAADKLE
jgi:hypothetical protein